MRITSAALEEFSTWLQERGRSEDTAAIYASHLRQSAAHPKGMTGRLLGELAPNTKRTNLAALAAWAKFSKDDELRDRLDNIRLPPARRVQVKIPLSTSDWRAYVEHLETCKLPRRDEPLRHVMVIVAIRGLRCSDALRIKRTEIHQALRTGTLSFRGKGSKQTEFSAQPMRGALEALSKVNDREWTVLRELVSKTHKGAALRVWRRMKAEGKRAGISGIYPHQLRRTYATSFLEQLHGDPRAIMKLQKHMNWESLNTAASYADAVDVGELDQVGERMTTALRKK